MGMKNDDLNDSQGCEWRYEIIFFVFDRSGTQKTDLQKQKEMESRIAPYQEMVSPNHLWDIAE